ncbi:MAG: hypothetical protein AAGJ94_18040 [Pseudomonadota bacterium]
MEQITLNFTEIKYIPAAPRQPEPSGDVAVLEGSFEFRAPETDYAVVGEDVGGATAAQASTPKLMEAVCNGRVFPSAPDDGITPMDVVSSDVEPLLF